MREAEALISKLADEGKPPQAIAEELKARGLRGRKGRVFSASDVEGFLRFIGTAGIEIKGPVKISSAVWGRPGVPAERSIESRQAATKRAKKRTNRWNPGILFPDERKEEIARLYQKVLMSPSEIAAKLALPLRRVQTFCAFLAGYSVPPGEFAEIVDELGRTVTICPPGFARGVYPQGSVRPTQGGW